MNILGIDPGATTGWCCYDPEIRCVLSAGQFRGFDFVVMQPAWASASHVVIERPVAYGPTRPPVVECAYIAGRLFERLAALGDARRVVEMERREVKKILTEATQKDVVVTDDATAWAALKLLHGEGCDKKGGALHGVKAHERAALAVAVAWVLRSAVPAGART